MKNRGKIIIVLAISVALVVYGTYFIKNQQKLAVEQFKTSEQALLKTIEQEAIDGQYQQIQVPETDTIFLLLPTNGPEIIKDVQADMTALAQQLDEQDGHKGPIKTVLTATVNEHQQNVQRYNYVQTRYYWNKRKKEWEDTTHPLKEQTLINTLTGHKLTLGDIFTNQQNLLKVNRSIQEELLAAAKEPKKEVNQILALPTLLASQTDFTLGQTSVTIHYAPDHYLKDYTINYDQVGRFLNPDFVAAHYLKETPHETVTPQAKVVALTFDDGPSDKTTPSILKTLKKKKIPATFFMLGQQAEKFPDIVKQIADDGHELANHSYNHPNLTELSAVDVRQQINQTQAAIYQASGVLPKYVRPPYGSFNYETAVAIGLPLVNWSVDSLDWKTKNSKKINDEIKTTIGADSIILMHDIHQETAAALEKTITDLQKEGYQFVTISDLLQVTANPLNVYFSTNNQQAITPP